jgi:hypothetical protein
MKTCRRISRLAALFIIALISLLTGDSGAFTAALAEANEDEDHDSQTAARLTHYANAERVARLPRTTIFDLDDAYADAVPQCRYCERHATVGRLCPVHLDQVQGAEKCRQYALLQPAGRPAIRTGTRQACRLDR